MVASVTLAAMLGSCSIFPQDPVHEAAVKAMGDDTVVTRMRMKNKGAATAAQEIQQLFAEVIPDELVNRAAA